MLRHCALLSVALSVLVARPAFAAEFSSREDNYEAGYDPGKQKRRSDFMMGLGLGLGFGSAHGYPNEVAKIGDPKYDASTGFGGGNATSLWIGVAFRDWLVFGIGPHFYTIQSSGCPALVSQDKAPAGCTAAFGGGFMVHVEAFPFFYEAPALQNLGIFTELGAGTRKIQSGPTTVADGGFLSFASIGVAYEPINLWDHLSLGPYIQVSHEFSENLIANQGVVGFRAVYYGGP
jgi:hypothetical protein